MHIFRRCASFLKYTSDYFWAIWFQVGVLNPVLLQHSWLFTGINCWWNSEKRAAEWVVYFFDKTNIFRDKGANYKLKKGPLKSPHLMQSSFPSSFNEQLYATLTSTTASHFDPFCRRKVWIDYRKYYPATYWVHVVWYFLHSNEKF